MNYIETSFQNLVEEALVVKENIANVNYGPERLKQQHTRLGMIALEILSREAESEGHDPQAMFAFSAVEYFGLRKEAPGLRLGTASVDVYR